MEEQHGFLYKHQITDATAQHSTFFSELTYHRLF